MPRLVIVNETTEPATATPYGDHAAAFSAYKQQLLAFVTTSGLYEPGDDDYELLAKATTPDELGSWPQDGPLFLLDEGEQGVWTGFISSDRCGTGGPLPLPDDDFLGNGDPDLYLTADAEDGQAVPVMPSVTKEGVHPLYQEWLTEHGDD